LVIRLYQNHRFLYRRELNDFEVGIKIKETQRVSLFEIQPKPNHKTTSDTTPLGLVVACSIEKINPSQDPQASLLSYPQA
jgi:hypothetical protein